MEPLILFLIVSIGFSAFARFVKTACVYSRLKNIQKIIFKKKEKLNNRKLKKLKREEKEECIFCYEEYKVKDKVIELYCGHVYHSKCLKRWFNESLKCPLCNLPVLTSTGIRIDEFLKN